MTVIADTSPLHYLILTGHVDVLPNLYGVVLIPPAVLEELMHPSAPHLVRQWITNRPAWLQVQAPQIPADARLLDLDAGEREALTLALEQTAELVLIDERDGRTVAQACGLRVAGTLRVLANAAQKGLLVLPEAFARLQTTGFRASATLLDQLLAEVRAALEGPDLG